jgi:protein-tyrosine sulfotransferase
MNLLKRIKYRVVVPFIVELLKFVIGSRNTKTFEKSDFFFIIGSGRNGSTLLSTLLNNNSQIFIPPEQYVIPFYAASWQFMRVVKIAKFYSKFADQLSSRNKTVNWEMSWAELNNIEFDSTSFEGLVRSIFYAYSTKKNKTAILFGEKSPLTTHYLKLQENEFPNAKYLFLIRDPRDVIYSFSKVENHDANDFNFALWKWKDAVVQYERLQRKGKNILLVKYEEMVADSQSILKEVHFFLKIPFDPETLTANKNAADLGVGNLEHHQNLRNPINTDSIGKWRGNLDQKQLLRIDQKLGRIALKYGYNLNVEF